MPIPEPIVYQFKVVLQGISPTIWRRLLVCGDSTITDLHHFVQIAISAFNWIETPPVNDNQGQGR